MFITILLPEHVEYRRILTSYFTPRMDTKSILDSGYNSSLKGAYNLGKGKK